nr:PREDICTED: inter-alpha-trypsin inhibitor heavy chain H6-like isoform X1 [Lepisosteus oculatus]
MRGIWIITLLYFVLFCFMTSVQRGSSEKYRARFQDSPNKADANVYLERIKRQTKPQKAELKVTDFHIRSMVVSRYAQTTVESSVWNQLAVNKEAAFEVDLPSTAFISNFSITSNGKVYVAEVKERSQAKKIYDEAKKRGKTAGLVATKERETEKFRVAVSVPAGSQMTFTLTYEELLQRRLGRYELALSVRPEQPVSNLTVGVTISERTGISFVRVLPLRKTKLLSNTVQADAEMPPSTEVLRSPSCARISFTPTIKEQTVMSTKGISADFVVQYDVELKDLIGDVQIYDGYFVHYFAPRGLPVVPKDVIFVIDTSGSMLGTKIKQTKEAMKIILSDLRENDYFNIITFSHSVNTWKTETTIKATPKNVKEAQAFVKKISASGSTDINSALLNAAKLVNTKNPRKGSGNHVPLIIFLTDGEPTTGVTSGERIVNNAKEALGTASLFGLAFGNDADYPLMRRLSMENRGVARMIYEDADATLQLKGFYDEVASPLLFDIQLNYLDNHVYDVTRALFPNFFQGSELVVAGRIKPGVKDLKVKVNAMDSEKQLTVENDVTVPSSGNATFGCPGDLQGISGFVRRLWAYFTIKDLLQAKLNNTDPATQRILTEKATNLSLKYNFVSPVTSLVVVKPDTEEASLNATSTTTATTTTTTTTTTATTATTTTTTMPTHTTSTVTHTPFLFSKLALHSTRKSDTTTTSSSKTSKPRPESVPSTKFPGHPSGLQTTGRVLPTSTSFPAKTVASPESQSRTATSEHRPTTASAAPGGLSTNRTDAFWVTAPAPPPGTTAMPHITEMGTDIEIARFISATFMPMVGFTEEKLYAGEAIQDVSSVVQVQIKDTDQHEDFYYYGEYNDIVYPDNYYYDLDSTPSNVGSASSRLIFAGSADGDPHFVVHLPKLSENICFTIDGLPNDVLRLVDDPEKGLTVDGHLMWAPSKVGFEDKTRTYFSQLSFSVKMGSAEPWNITVSLGSIVLEGEEQVTMFTDRTGTVKVRDLKITIDSNQTAWVTVGQDIGFMVLFHHYKHPTYLQLSHLGLYIANGQGLSPSTHGLLGQFQHADIEILRTTDTARHAEVNTEGKQAMGELRRNGERIPIVLVDKKLKDSVKKKHAGRCWVIAKPDVEKLIGGTYQSFVVDHL